MEYKYAKVENGKIVKFPYSMDDLRRENPNTSFPRELSDQILEAYSLERVYEMDPPMYNQDTHRVILHEDPYFEDGFWKRGYTIHELSDEEIRAKNQQVKEFVLSERKRMLEATDWMALSDNTLSPEWAAYRQALRDIADQPGFPHDIDWPTPPER